MIGSVAGRHAVPFPMRLPSPLFRVWKAYRTFYFWVLIKRSVIHSHISFYVRVHPVVHFYALVSLFGIFYVAGQYFSH